MIALQVEGMTCLACARRVEEALRGVAGVEQASVRYPTGATSVTTAGGVDLAELVEAVARIGYSAAPVEADRPRAAAVPVAAAPANNGGADYDLIVIGTGGAGTAAAIRGAELGARVAIVEAAEVVGGTCVNVGCIPSKYLIEAAHHFHSARSAFAGIAPCEVSVAWEALRERKREIIAELRDEKYLAVLAAYPEITLLRGHARLLGGGRVSVGDTEVSAGALVVATGARPAMPPIPGLAEANALDSTAALELGALPASLVVLGAGSVGLELAQAFARFGVRVTVLEAAERILPLEEPLLSDTLRDALRAGGMEIHTGIEVARVERGPEGFVVALRDGAITGEIHAEQLLVATGRAPNTADLGLDAAGVATDARGFIPVDALMRTSNDRVFAAGDVTGGPGYVYVAALQGGIAAQAALAERAPEGAIPIDLTVVPRVVFTDPQVAAVGMTEAEARAAGLRAHATTLPVSALPRAAVSGRGLGVIQLVAEVGTDRLLGAHAIAPNAGDWIGEAALAVRFGLTTRDIVSTLHAYLTWGEGLKLAAQTFTKDVAKLSCCA